MTGRYAGKHGVVVGGTHGIGLAIARQLVAEGATVVVTGRNPDNARAAAEVLGDAGTVVRGDVTDAGDVAALREQVEAASPRVDALFVNVGVAALEPVREVTEESYDRQFAVNTKGAFFAAQRLLPLVSEGGGVVFTTVTAAPQSPGLGVYSATKAAVRAFAHTLAAEVVADGIRVNTIAPGFIDTPTGGFADASAEERAELHAAGDAATPMGRHGTPEEVARAAVFLALEATFTTGTELQVDGGISGISVA